MTSFICFPNNNILENFESNLYIIVYSECNYQGVTARLNTGRYNLNDLKSLKINTIKSLYIPDGMNIVIYYSNFSNDSIDSNDSDDSYVSYLTSEACVNINLDSNDSLLVMKANTTPRPTTLPSRITLPSKTITPSRTIIPSRTKKPKILSSRIISNTNEIDDTNNINTEKLLEQENNSISNKKTSIYFYIGITIIILVILSIISYLVYIYYIKPSIN